MYRSWYRKKIERCNKRISIFGIVSIIATFLTVLNVFPNTNLDAVVCVGITCIFLLLKSRYERLKKIMHEKEYNIFNNEMISKQKSSDAKADRALVLSKIALLLVIAIGLYWTNPSFITNRSNENIGLVQVR